MKTLFTCIALLIGASFCTNKVQAQFLKNILNSVKQSGQNRADSKANQAANKVMDKADSALQIKSGGKGPTGLPVDTTSTNKVLNAFAKAAAENPNDTSAADVTMKALGILTGGGGVSAADSAKAISSFKTAAGGSGVVYEYLVTTTSKMGATKDTTSEYFTRSGDGRAEMKMSLPGTRGNKMINIGRVSQPTYSIGLYPETKTFSLNVIDTSLINSAGGIINYTVTKIGNETVQGYHCIHAKVTSVAGAGMFKSSSTMDIYTSNDVPGYSLLKGAMHLQRVEPKMMQALDNAGCGGMFVKMIEQGKDYNMNMTLIKAEEKRLPAEMFSIPAGYQQSDENMIYHMLAPAKK